MPEDKTLELNEDEFWRIYEPIEDPQEGTVFNTPAQAVRMAVKHGVAKEDQVDGHIWTISDGDDGWGAYATPGIHGTGFGYCVTKAPHLDENVCGEWWDPEAHRAGSEE